MDDESKRRLRAKRFDEHLKLLVTTLNVIALAIFGAGVLQPLVLTGPDATPFSLFNLVWIALSVALHLLRTGTHSPDAA